MTTSNESSLPDEAILLGAHADDWRGAVRLAGDALVAAGITTPVYSDEMVAAVETLGPYIVIAPGFALAHARPSAAVLRTGISWVQLDEPVVFGHAKNDPVDLVAGLAAVDHDAHLGIMSTLARALADPAVMTLLRETGDAAGVRRALDLE